MQKKIIALAIAGLASTAAFAQSNVTIYGRADYGFVHTNGSDGGAAKVKSTNSFMSGVEAGSRIGFKGTEDIGGGMKVIFQSEFGQNVDGLQSNSGVDSSSKVNSNNTSWWNRNSWVGVTGNFGTVLGGRVDGARYSVFAKYDSFANGTVGNMAQMDAQVNRANNAVAYVSPTFAGGFSFLGAYVNQAFGQEATGNINDMRIWVGQLNYDNGPLSATLNLEKLNSHDDKACGASTSGGCTLGGLPPNSSPFDARVWDIGLSYDFGVVKVSGLIDRVYYDNSFGGGNFLGDHKNWFLSAKMPMGAFTFKTSYGRFVVDVDGKDPRANKFGLGMDYNLSKRTNIYVDYGRISNNSASAKGISVSGWASGAQGTNGFDVGIAHNF